MHPYLMGEVIRQRTAERQEEARKGRLARSLRKASRQRGRDKDTFVVPPIPDYVDGTFRTAEDGANQVPAGRAGR